MAVTSTRRQTVAVRCAFCRGTGRDPFGIMSWLSSCCVCSGRRRVTIETPYGCCPHCNSTGAIKTLRQGYRLEFSLAILAAGTGKVDYPSSSPFAEIE